MIDPVRLVYIEMSSLSDKSMDVSVNSIYSPKAPLVIFRANKDRHTLVMQASKACEEAGLHVITYYPDEKILEGTVEISMNDIRNLKHAELIDSMATRVAGTTLLSYVEGSIAPHRPEGPADVLTLKVRGCTESILDAYTGDFERERGRIEEWLERSYIGRDEEGSACVETARFIKEITVTDPDSKGDVSVAIYKDPSSGAIFGIDSSYVEQMKDGEEDTIASPFDNNVRLKLQ